MAVVHRIYAQALLEAARERQVAPEGPRASSSDFAARRPRVGRARAGSCGTRRSTRAPRGRSSTTDARGADDEFRNFLHLLTEKNRLPEVLEIYEEWERLLAAEEQVLEVELTTAIELSDEEAAEIVKQIEDAAKRKVEATRAVDPDLIGGLVLQAGSLRVDASVRGRLNDLREDLLQRA